MTKDEKKPHGMNQYKKIWAHLNGMKAKDEIIETTLTTSMERIAHVTDVKLYALDRRLNSGLRLCYLIAGIALAISVVALIIAL